MAMLAERKSKVKWCLNPRGQDWVQDSNKFGQKLLEKMGWKSGKGLGRQEDGITEHIKVALKSDSKGLGFKEDANPWTENEEHFANLLKNLSENSEVLPTKIQSLEKKSKSSKARVHYRKFTRGKDLSRYSAKDLANIFGKSVSEFVQPGFDNPALNLSIDDDGQSQELDTPLKNKKKNNGLDNPGLDVSIDPSQEEPIKKSKKKKKKGLDNPALNVSIEVPTEIPEVKLSKKSKKIKPEGLDNPALNVSLDEVPNEIPGVKRSKKSKKIKPELIENSGLDNPGLNLSIETDQEKPEIPELEPVKKSKKNKLGLDNKTLNLSVENEDTESSVKPIKKSKKTKSELVEKSGLDNPCLNLSTDDDVESSEPAPSKKSKKKKKGLVNFGSNVIIDEPGIENLGLDLSAEDQGVTRKRKRGETEPEIIKKSKHEGYVNTALELTDDKPKKRKKKKVIETPKSALRKPGGRRKSVQINESLNQEKFITDSEHSMSSPNTTLQIENYQSELDNAINEKKVINEPGKYKHLVLGELQNGNTSINFPGVPTESISGYGTLLN